MQQIAMSWLVYRMTNSTVLLGLVGFVSQIPIFILPPFIGVFADRWNKRSLVIIIQSLAMLQAFILAFLILSNMIQVWHIIVLGLFLGVVNSMDIPVRQSFVIEMVEKKEDLGNAIALNSSLVNVGRLLGPSIGGILIYLVGEGLCFLLNGVSYIAVIASLFAMRIKPMKSATQHANILRGIKEGFTYSFGSVPIRSILMLLTLVSLIGMPYQLLMPVFARDILHGTSQTQGFLMAAAGIGALGGSIFLASRKSVIGLGKLISSAAIIFGCGLIFFSISRLVIISLIFMAITGYGMIVQLASSNTVLQTITDDDKRGRVMSFYTMSFRGMSPFGSLMTGTLASSIGAPMTLTVGGICCILGGLLFAKKLPSLRNLVKPIYIRKGILPETEEATIM
jgi:MFS family permease